MWTGTYLVIITGTGRQISSQGKLPASGNHQTRLARRRELNQKQCLRADTIRNACQLGKIRRTATMKRLSYRDGLFLMIPGLTGTKSSQKPELIKIPCQVAPSIVMQLNHQTIGWETMGLRGLPGTPCRLRDCKHLMSLSKLVKVVNTKWLPNMIRTYQLTMSFLLQVFTLEL